MAGPQKVAVAAAVSVVLKAAGPRPRRCHQFTVMQVTHARGKGRLRDEGVLGGRPKAPHPAKGTPSPRRRPDHPAPT